MKQFEFVCNRSANDTNKYANTSTITLKQIIKKLRKIKHIEYYDNTQG